MRDSPSEARPREIAEILLDAARQLGETLEPERVYERFHELLAEVIQHDGLIVSSFDERDDAIRCQYAWTDGAVLDASTLPPIPLNREGGGMQSQVIVTGQALFFNDVARRTEVPDGVYYNVDREGQVKKIPEKGAAETTAAMMVPVKDEGRVVGVVQLMTDHGEYNVRQLELFEGLVAQMGAAVRNARLQQERRRLEAAEAAARAAAAEWEQAAKVLEAVGDGIFLVDDGGAVRVWNRTAELVTGVRADRVRGRELDYVIPEWPTLAARIPIAESGGIAAPVTLPLQVAGSDLWLSFVAVRIVDGIVYAFRDVTAERRLEEDRSDFVATISHELRTPMAAVYGAARTLLRDDIELPPERRRELLEIIGEQASRLSRITEEVLLTSKLDRGEVAVEHEPVDVGATVRAAVEALRTQCPDSMSIEVDIAEDVGAASGDPHRLQQVLVNLLDNALKYGDGRIRVHTTRTDGVVRISVGDDGPGISFSEQERVFEKFYRSDPDQLRAPGGTGLGLYIARELARRMSGRLDLTSEPGGGATFVIELPSV
jgi:PAS domain S-box-containing protein